MKFRSISLTYAQVNSKRVGITNLEDTRNIQYEKIAVLNLIEGKIPAVRQIPFLFTEKQRKIMNLKTYEEIKLREKYYFLRLVLNSILLFLFYI